MKNSTMTILGIGALAGLAYYLFTKKDGASLPAFVTTSEYQGQSLPSIPLLEPFIENPQATQAQNAQAQAQAKEQNTDVINYLFESAKGGQTVTFRDSSGRVVGVQDAKAQMSYRIETPPKTSSVVTSTQKTNIVGTPYTVSSTVAKTLNNPLAVAVANLQKKSTLKK